MSKSSLPPPLPDFEREDKRLRSTPGFTDVGFGGYGPLPGVTWAKTPKARRYGLKQLPAELTALFEEFCFISCGWNYYDPAVSPHAVTGGSQLGLVGIGIQYNGWQGSQSIPFWGTHLPEERQAVYKEYRLFDWIYQLTNTDVTVWREVNGRVELALYRAPDSLHPLPFSPLEYVQTGTALRFIEHWQLLFIPEAEQAPYADLLAATAYYVQQLFPDAAHLLPPHVAARAAAPTLPPGPDYRAHLAEAAQHLRTVPGLTVTGMGLRPGASLRLLDRARRELGRPLPPALLAFYGQCNGHDLRWEWEGTFAGGALELLPLEETLGGPHYASTRYWDAHVYDELLWGAGHIDYILDRLAREGQPTELPATGLKLFDHAADTVWGS